LATTTTYWLVWRCNNTGNTHFYPPEWGIGVHYDEASPTTDMKFSFDGTVWEDTGWGYHMYWRLYDGPPSSPNNRGTWLFEYKRALYDESAVLTARARVLAAIPPAYRWLIPWAPWHGGGLCEGTGEDAIE
jgi:hypothetical protein